MRRGRGPVGASRATRPGRVGWPVLLAWCLAGLALLLVGCGEANPKSGGAGSEALLSAEAVFDSLPRFPRSEQVGPTRDVEGTISRSFLAQGVRPEWVLDHFDQQLGAQWELRSAPRVIGVGTHRGKWADDRWTLTVSATVAETLGAEGKAATERIFSTQYSLSLSPVSS